MTDTEKESLVGALKSWYESDWGNDIQEYVLSSEGTFSILFVDGTSVSASLDNIAKGKNNVRPAAPVIEVKEETRTEPVVFKTVRRANPEQGVGYEQVVQAGVNGERTIVETVTLTDGKETSRVEKSNQITKEPVDKVIEYGTKAAPIIGTTKGENLDSNKKTNFLSMDERELPPLQKDVKEPKNQQVLPQTGEITQLFLPLATFMIVTASAVIDLKPRKKE